jgi:hypothetical protein
MRPHTIHLVLALLTSACIPEAPNQCNTGDKTPAGVCVTIGPQIDQISGVDAETMAKWVQDAQDAYGHQLSPGYRVDLYRSQDIVSFRALRDYAMDVPCLSGYNDEAQIVAIPGAFIHELAHREIAAEGIEEPGYMIDTISGEYIDAHTPEYGWDEQRLRRINDAARAAGTPPGGAGRLCKSLR